MSLHDVLQTCTPAKVVAVSKLQPPIKVRRLHAEGQRLFGENYVQEALEKMETLADLPDIEWHLIGHLQKNKVKLVAGRFALIHSVDSLELAKTLHRHCEANRKTQNILLQVNLAQENSKQGFESQQLLTIWSELIQLSSLRIQGLMTMPPLTENPEEVRPYFKALRELLEELKTKTDLHQHPLTELSMGTSHDYQVALSEGATILRLGTILFGERSPRG